MSSMWLLWAIAAPCPAPSGPALLVVTAADAQLRREAPAVESRLRQVLTGRLPLLPSNRAVQALTVEGGRADRAAAVVQAKVRMERAFERFRELEDRAALDHVSEVIARLSAVSQSLGAVELLAEAHLLAGAIFLARDRVDASQARLRRALQLAPDIEAPPARYAPRVRAELAALRGDPGPMGWLTVELTEPHTGAEVFVDGRSLGPVPIDRAEVPAGRHLIRVSAPGRLSFHTTARVESTQLNEVRAQLPIDPEVSRIDDVAGWIGEPQRRGETLGLIARRAEAETVLLAEVRLSERRSATATATRAVVLRLGDRPAQTTGLDRESLVARIDALLTCGPGQVPPTTAPALTEWTLSSVAARPRAEPAPWYRQTWVWATFALVAVGTAGAFAAARHAEGPPDAVEITLVPRP